MKPQTSSIQLAVVLSDLHCGSTVGLWPPGFLSQEGVPIGQNAFQEWLWKCWIDLHTVELPKYLGDDPYVLILNGDAVEGIRPRDLQLMTANPTDQMEAAQAILAPISGKAQKIFVVKGTDFHTNDREITLGKVLKAQRNSATGQHAFDKLKLNIHGCDCVFRHHMPTAMRPYLEATGLSTELGSERIEAARQGHPVPSVLCMAHRHRHGIFKDLNGLVCVTSAWQGLTRHGFRVVGSALPAPSCVVLDWRKKEQGEIPHAEDFIYLAEAPKSITI